jgi:prepilin-type N-terminal cleavage/methylation domain-containing protein
MRGFSLTEVLVGLLILTLIITTSLAVFVERNRRLQQASEMILAYQALANEAELTRKVPFANVASASTFLGDTTLLQPLQPYATIVAVRETNPGVKNVLMTIRWKEGKREAKLEVIRVDTGG